MEESYIAPGGHAAVYTRYLGDGDWEIENVTTTPAHRGEGLQRELWKRVLADADSEGAHLLLTVGSGRGAGNKGLDHRQLWRWYERLGFNGLAGTRMERVPATCDDLELADVLRRATLSEPGGAG